MRQKIDLFLPCEDLDVAQEALLELHDNKTVQHINLLVSADFAASHQVPDGCTFIVVDRLESSNTVSSIAENTDADYVIICTKATPIRWGLYALERFLRTADDTGAVMVYSDHYSVQEGKLGSIRSSTIRLVHFVMTSISEVSGLSRHRICSTMQHSRTDRNISLQDSMTFVFI